MPTTFIRGEILKAADLNENFTESVNGIAGNTSAIAAETARASAAEALLMPKATLAASTGLALSGTSSGNNAQVELDITRAGRTKQRTSIMAVAKAASYVKALYYRGSGQSDRFFVGYNINGENGAEFQIQGDFDNMMMVRGMNANNLISGNATIATNLTGSYNTSSHPNSYAAAPTATFDLPFTGTGLRFRAYTDNRGGIWQFVIDGGAPITISTWSSVASDAANPPEQVVVTGLANAAHTCTATFMGDDPAHAPTGGVSRGWLFYNPTNALQYTGYGITTSARLMRLSSAKFVMASSSICEFAMTATKTGSGISADWVPAHSNAGACRNITTEILVDGVSVGTDYAAYPAISECSCVIVKHTYDAYSTYDTGGSNKLWTGVLIKKFDRDGLKISHSITLVNDVTCNAGYFAPMVPVTQSEIGEATFNTGFRDTIDVVAIDTDVSVPGVPSSAIFYNSTDRIGIAYEIDSVADALGLYDKPLESDAVFLQERGGGAGIGKAYWRRWTNETIPNGGRYSITATLFPVLDIDMAQFS